ncbi:uncharacterized protein LOC132795919 [Drosophila nasuta]|uniref:uncharacterized protein LOC132795919 n=1 Tax=Drosophila nasuta TaxID=42062 RepID=UPI00295F5429|nr:uncharacterized protein LOC132795919 [Drosophila nasuta]
MSGTRSRINIYVPTVNRFPELRVNGGGGFRGHDAVTATVEGLPSLAGAKTQTTTTKEATMMMMAGDEAAAAAALGEELGVVGGSGRSLYVIDSQGRRLEHVRYQGDDYRYALRAAINAMPTNWKE